MNQTDNSEEFSVKQIIYLDRNNTPDVWPDIKKTIETAYSNQPLQQKSFKSVIILPEQHSDFDPSSYKMKNPICPQMMFECIKRIFGRPSHDCLSASNKPKVVEVILKFAKLYDGADFYSSNSLLTHFDDFIHLDFMQFGSRSKLDKGVVATITQCFNETPDNFQCPSDEVIALCITAVDH